MFLENMTHYLTALVIIMKGLDKLGVPGKTWVSVIFLLMGILIVLGTIFHHKAEKLLRHFKAYVFAFEAIAMAVVGYLYLKDGKQFIQYVCFAASIMFVIALVVYFRRRKKLVHSIE
jgi:predicted MFS family arabinose efflux permease